MSSTQLTSFSCSSIITHHTPRSLRVLLQRKRMLLKCNSGEVTYSISCNGICLCASCAIRPKFRCTYTNVGIHTYTFECPDIYLVYIFIHYLPSIGSSVLCWASSWNAFARATHLDNDANISSLRALPLQKGIRP